MFPVRKCKHRREKKDRLANQVRCSPGHRKVVNTYQEELSTVLNFFNEPRAQCRGRIGWAAQAWCPSQSSAWPMPSWLRRIITLIIMYKSQLLCYSRDGLQTCFLLIWSRVICAVDLQPTTKGSPHQSRWMPGPQVAGGGGRSRCQSPKQLGPMVPARNLPSVTWIMGQQSRPNIVLAFLTVTKCRNFICVNNQLCCSAIWLLHCMGKVCPSTIWKIIARGEASGGQ